MGMCLRLSFDGGISAFSKEEIKYWLDGAGESAGDDVQPFLFE
jgi:hypothetical protein